VKYYFTVIVLVTALCLPVGVEAQRLASGSSHKVLDVVQADAPFEPRVLRVPEITYRDPLRSTDDQIRGKDHNVEAASPSLKSTGIGTATTYTVYAPDGKLVAEYDEDGSCTREYFYAGETLLAEYRPNAGEYFYYITDQVRSTRLTFDESGVVVHSAAFGPYGEAAVTWLDDHEPKLRFSGKERDKATGQDYFGARYYDEGIRRFTAVDPIRMNKDRYFDLQMHNLYSYVRGNPLVYSDLFGEDLYIAIRFEESAGFNNAQQQRITTEVANRFTNAGVNNVFAYNPEEPQLFKKPGANDVFVSVTVDGAKIKDQVHGRRIKSGHFRVTTYLARYHGCSEERVEINTINWVAHEAGHGTGIFPMYEMDGAVWNSPVRMHKDGYRQAKPGTIMRSPTPNVLDKSHKILEFSDAEKFMLSEYLNK
jgi:RHS repeat-associated protein